MQIRLKLRGEVYEADLAEQLRIHKRNLKAGFLSQPVAVGWWGTLKAMLDGSLRERRRIFEKKKAKIWYRLRDEVKGEGLRPTEKEIGNRLVLDEEYDRLLKRKNQLEEWCDYAKAAVIALSNRKVSLKGILYERHRQHMEEDEEE
jgi:hypothetical protein